MERQWQIAVEASMQPSIPLRSYFLVVGLGLLSCLWLIASWLEPAPQQSSALGLGITPAHAKNAAAEDASTSNIPLFDRMRALPIK